MIMEYKKIKYKKKKKSKKKIILTLAGFEPATARIKGKWTIFYTTNTAFIPTFHLYNNNYNKTLRKVV